MSEIKQKKVDESVDVDKDLTNLSYFQALKLLATNKVFMLLSFGMAFDAYMKTGLMNFGPKTLEVRFHVSVRVEHFSIT